MIGFLVTAAATFVGAFVAVPAFLGFARFFGLYVSVEERKARVYQLFGDVVGVVDEPGLHILPVKLGWRAFLVNWIGKCHVVDLRIDQQYLRSNPVNSEEGAPMGIGIWYEMQVKEPTSFLFKNNDPRGSLAANVSNAAVR